MKRYGQVELVQSTEFLGFNKNYPCFCHTDNDVEQKDPICNLHYERILQLCYVMLCYVMLQHISHL